MPSCVIEAISADRLPWLMSSAPPIDVAGSDTVSSSQANSAMTRTQREAKKVCVEREDDMLGKLISRRPPRSTRFCPAPDGCKATGHISPYFFDSFRFALDVDGNCALHARPSAIRSTMTAWAIIRHHGRHGHALYPASAYRCSSPRMVDSNCSKRSEAPSIPSAAIAFSTMTHCSATSFSPSISNAPFRE